MLIGLTNRQHVLLLLLALAGTQLLLSAKAASCKTQSQMTAAERDEMSSAAHTVISEVQSGDVQALRTNTIPAIAADFGAIVGSVDSLKPFVQGAAITVDSLYLLDASAESAGVPRIDFYCGTPLVVLNFTDLSPGIYATVILHATGVSHPQQISLMLSETVEHRWLLAGLFNKPLVEAGHEGLWYWVSARKYAEKKMNWNAWFYYRTAAYLLDPVEFLSSPNLEKLQHEEGLVRPTAFPGAKPMMLEANGSVFQVTAIDTTAALGTLDIEVHYAPDAAQASELHNPPTARKQVTEVMTALMAVHPELQEAFHGIWVYADEGSASLFSLELPMEQIVLGKHLHSDNSSPVAR